MPDELRKLLLTAGLAVLLTIVWMSILAYVYFDVKRRKLPVITQVSWILATVLIAPLALPVYWTVMRSRGGGIDVKTGSDQAPARGVTLLKPLPQQEVRLPTIAASELMKSTGPGEVRAPGRGAGNQATEGHQPGLVALEGPHAGDTFPFLTLPVVIGRGSSAGIRLDKDFHVSRRHAEIYLQADALRLRDLGSDHGTRRNGKPAHDVLLLPGDQISLGSSILKVSWYEASKNNEP